MADVNGANGASKERAIRYGIVGLGHIAQIAVLPAFQHAKENSQLVAFVSDDPVKLKELGKEYGVEHLYDYEHFDECLREAELDAVYIALPNSMHKEYAVRAAESGVHVLCEKPMAMDVDECMDMIATAEQNEVKLMIAYRLHFEEANMKMVEEIKAAKIGEPRYFNSSFSQQVKEGDIRLNKQLGGGVINDIGIYCINAARYLFQDEPKEVLAMSATGSDPRFKEVPEMISVMMRFPGEKIASFVCSFGAADMSRYEVVGTEGHIVLDPAYSYAEKIEIEVAKGDKENKKEIPKRDQFAPELVHFSDCILFDKEPEPSGYEGLADMIVIDAINRSIKSGKVVEVQTIEKSERPDGDQIMKKPGVDKPKLVNVEAPTK